MYNNTNRNLLSCKITLVQLQAQKGLKIQAGLYYTSTIRVTGLQTLAKDRRVVKLYIHDYGSNDCVCRKDRARYQQGDAMGRHLLVCADPIGPTKRFKYKPTVLH